MGTSGLLLDRATHFKMIFALLLLQLVYNAQGKVLLIETGDDATSFNNTVLENNKACCRERWRTCVRGDGSEYKCLRWKEPAYEKACVDEDGKTRKAGETWGEGGCDCWVWGCRKDCPEFDCTCGKVDKCAAEQEDPNLWKKPLSPK